MCNKRWHSFVQLFNCIRVMCVQRCLQNWFLHNFFDVAVHPRNWLNITQNKSKRNEIMEWGGSNISWQFGRAMTEKKIYSLILSPLLLRFWFYISLSFHLFIFLPLFIYLLCFVQIHSFGYGLFTGEKTNLN